MLPKVNSKVTKARLTNLPAVILLMWTVGVLMFHYDRESLAAALDPRIIRPLMAEVTAISLILYFFIGSDGLKLLLAATILASVAIVAHMIIEWRTPVAHFVIEIVRRTFWVLIVLCLYLWDRDREAKARSTTAETTTEMEEGNGPPGSKSSP
jgi:hypothetical protein